MYRLPAILYAIFLFGCSKEPIYPYDEPIRVEIIDAVVIENKEIHLLDNFVINVKIEALNDFGLAYNLSTPPFHKFDTIIDADGNTISPTSTIKLPLYKLDGFGNKEKIDLDTVPPYCSEYYTPIGSHEYILVEKNIYNNNLHIQFLTEDNEDLFALPVFGKTNNCYLQGRLISLRIPFLIDRETELGEYFVVKNLNRYQKIITLPVTSSGWQYFKSQNTLFKVRITVIDSELNISEPYVTELMTVDEIWIND